MTLKEFAEVYNLPYTTVWQASYDVKPRSTEYRNKDFDEEELYKSVTHMLSQRSLEKARQAGLINEQREKVRQIHRERNVTIF